MQAELTLFRAPEQAPHMPGTRFEQIDYAVRDGVATVTLDRPDRRNAFTPVMCRELVEACDLVDADDAVRAVVVTGQRPAPSRPVLLRGRRHRTGPGGLRRRGPRGRRRHLRLPRARGSARDGRRNRP